MKSGGFSWTIDAVNQELAEVDKLMLLSVGSGQLGLAAANLINSGGKRLRPAILLTTAYLSANRLQPETLNAAAAVELIHLASLVHDDMLDDAKRRRQQPSAVSALGAKRALLLGDYLLAKAQTAAAMGGAEAAKLLSGAVAEMAAGEASELESEGKITPLRRPYFRVIRQKTASLFAASMSIGAVCGGLTARDAKSLRRFGLEFGMAFQIIDDVIDGRVPARQKTAAIVEVKRCNSAAEKSLAKFDGQAADSLKALPSAYLAWAWPL